MTGRIELASRHVQSDLPLANARTQWMAREHLLVTLRDEDGVVGEGEASPLPGISSDSVALVAGALAAEDRIALPITVPADVVVWLEHVSGHLASPSARFALDTALLDWLGRRTGKSAAVLLGAPPQRELRLCAVIDGPPVQWPARAAEEVAHGYGTLKFKVSPSALSEAVEALELLRRNMPALRCRLDANGTLGSAALVPFVGRLRAAEVEYVEEPGPGAVLELPVALDESLWDERWEQRVREHRARVIVVKPMAMGGVARVLRTANRARALGLGVVGSYLWEGPVGLACSIAVALASGSPELAHGLAPHRQLHAWPRFRIDALRGAWVRATAAPGLGLTWEER